MEDFSSFLNERRIFLAVYLTFSAWAKKVEMPDAMIAGKNFYFERINRHQVIPYDDIHLSLARSVTDNGVVLFYIFNADNRGFIIVSADDACTPVLGYSFDNVYTGTTQPGGFVSLLEAYRKEVETVKTLHLDAGSEIHSAWAVYSSNDF